MKRYGYIYEKIYDKENIRIAILRASKGKRRRNDVKRVLRNIDKYVDLIHEMLVNEAYEPTDYVTGITKEGTAMKERVIYKPNFYPDQIVHWAMILQVSPILQKGMYKYSCGSLPNRGVHYGKKHVRKWLDTDRKNTKYYLRMDVKKFYPSVRKEVLVEEFNRKFKDPKLLRLMEKILDKSEGLPIGILPSQWWGNFILTKIDYYIKQTLKVKYLIRYMDDIIAYARSKRFLHKIRRLVSEKLGGIMLKLKSNWQVCRTDVEFLDFMGFRFYRAYTTLRKAIMLRITRQVRKVYKKGYATIRNARAIISRLGWIKHSDSYHLFIKWVKPYLQIQILKNVIRKGVTLSYGARKTRKHRISIAV